MGDGCKSGTVGSGIIWSSGVGSVIKRSSLGWSMRLGGMSGIKVFTFPMAVNGFMRALFTRMDRPLRRRSRVPLGKTFETAYGPSHLSSSFSFVFKKSCWSRKTNCPGASGSSFTSSSCLCLYLSVFERAFLLAICLFRKRCLRRLSVV